MKWIKAILKTLLSNDNHKCLWFQVEGGWYTECSGFHRYKPEDNVCPYCGKEIEEVAE